VVSLLEGLQQRLGPYENKLELFRKEKQQYALRLAQAQLHPNSTSLISEDKTGNPNVGSSVNKPLSSNDNGHISIHNDETHGVNDAREEAPPQPPRKPRGLYIHGHVGTGKTVLMDMFFETTDIKLKRRVHLHEFMIDVHQRIHKWKVEERSRIAAEEEVLKKTQEERERLRAQANACGETNSEQKEQVELIKVRRGTAESDGITQVAEQLANEHTLLAFDEFVVNDVVDALILKHLFGVMFQHGVVVVATSNTAPEELYKDGLNYFYFAPFINILTSQCKVVDMDSSTDYRLIHGTDVMEDRVLSPITIENKERFDAIFAALTDGKVLSSRTVPVAFGRQVTAKACSEDVCRFEFDELCNDREPVMGAADFKALCETFDTIMIENVPKLGFSNHNATRRFITLVDQMYDRGVNIVLLAEAPPTELVQLTDSSNDVSHHGSSAGSSDELFSLKEMRMASKRLASRLVEMTSLGKNT